MTRGTWRRLAGVTALSIAIALNGCAADPFTLTQHGGVVDQVTIDLTFLTNTSTIDLISDVQLRNAEE